jgi:hypothetical protein
MKNDYPKWEKFFRKNKKNEPRDGISTHFRMFFPFIISKNLGFVLCSR